MYFLAFKNYKSCIKEYMLDYIDLGTGAQGYIYVNILNLVKFYYIFKILF